MKSSWRATAGPRVERVLRFERPAVRADEQVRETRILMLTAKGRDTDVARGVGVGADAYMIKPFSTRDLIQKVRELLA